MYPIFFSTIRDIIWNSEFIVNDIGVTISFVKGSDIWRTFQDKRFYTPEYQKYWRKKA